MTQDNWISTNDKMPESDVYIIFTDGEDVVFGEYSKYSHSFYGNDNSWHPTEITHWQLLPPPPNK